MTGFNLNSPWSVRGQILILGVATLMGGACAKKPPASDVSTTGQTESTDQAADSGDTTVLDGADSAMDGSQLLRVYFDFDSSELSDRARDILRNNAAYMKKNPNVSVVIEGHCDERGTNEYNLALGERRASSVRRYLQNLGVAGARIQTKSMGEERPLVMGSDESAWSQNRRAEFTRK